MLNRLSKFNSVLNIMNQLIQSLPTLIKTFLKIFTSIGFIFLRGSLSTPLDRQDIYRV